MDWEMPLSLSEIIDMQWVREKTDEIYKYEVTTDNVVFKDEAVYLEKLLRDSGFEDEQFLAADGVTYKAYSNLKGVSEDFINKFLEVLG